MDSLCRQALSQNSGPACCAENARTCLTVARPYRVVAGAPNPGTVMVLRVLATTEPGIRTTISTAKINTMTTRFWPMGARCAG